MRNRKQRNMKFGAEIDDLVEALRAGPDLNATRIFELSVATTAAIFQRSHTKALQFLYATLLDEIQHQQKAAVSWPDLLQIKTEHAILIKLADACAEKNRKAVAARLAEYQTAKNKYRTQKAVPEMPHKIHA